MTWSLIEPAVAAYWRNRPGVPRDYRRDGSGRQRGAERPSRGCCVRRRDAKAKLQAVRRMHRPVWDDDPWPYRGRGGYVCDECQFTDVEEAHRMDWPCGTAEIVFTEAEIQNPATVTP